MPNWNCLLCLFFFFKSNILFIFHKESGELPTFDWAASSRKQLNLIFFLSSYAFKYWISPGNHFKGPRPEFCGSSSTWPRWWSRFEFGIDPTNQHLITTSASPPFGTSFANLALYGADESERSSEEEPSSALPSRPPHPWHFHSFLTSLSKKEK